MTFIRPDKAPATSALLEGSLDLLNSIKERQEQIQKALDYTEGTHTLDDVVMMLITGRLRWWPLPNSFMITEIFQFPRASTLHVFLAGGDLQEIKDMNDALNEAAIQAGCSAVSLSGRRGWVKALQDIGWKENHTTMIRPVTYPVES